MNPKDIKTLIMYHSNIPNAKQMLRDMYANPETVERLVATNGIHNHCITTELHRTKTDYSGKPKIASIYLKGIEGKHLVPTISVPHDVENGVNLTLDLGGVSFTQKFRRKQGYRDFDSVFFEQVLLDDLHHRIMQTYLYRDFGHYSSKADPLLTPSNVKRILEQGFYAISTPHRGVKMELVKETTNANIEKVKDCGLIIKRTVTFFNKERKEDISYYVITATGRVMVFDGEYTTFDTPAKTGYVLLTDPPKVKK